MKTVNIQYLYFDDQVCGRCKEEQQASHCDDCSCLTGEDISCRSYGENDQLTKEQILTALKNNDLTITDDNAIILTLNSPALAC